MDTLLKALFSSWEAKKTPYLKGIIKEFQDTANEPCADNNVDAVFSFKMSDPPAMLESLKVIDTEEALILKLVLGQLSEFSWFNNTSEQWVNAPGNNGKTDTSCVLVGDTVNAPIRRSSLSMGLMYIGPHNTYPPHAHAPMEAYHTLAGEAWLTRNELSGIHIESGSVNTFDSYDTHALVTKDSGVLICWVNSGDVKGPYYFVDDVSFK